MTCCLQSFIAIKIGQQLYIDQHVSAENHCSRRCLYCVIDGTPHCMHTQRQCIINHIIDIILIGRWIHMQQYSKSIRYCLMAPFYDVIRHWVLYCCGLRFYSCLFKQVLKLVAYKLSSVVVDISRRPRIMRKPDVGQFLCYIFACFDVDSQDFNQVNYWVDA